MDNSISDRIANSVNVNAETGCWEWQKGKTADGYGQIYISGKQYYTHRVVYMIFNGETDLCVLHECDNPCCCNPEHLFAGTRKDNMVDCISKGRNNRGQLNGRSKLTEHDVIEIKSLAKQSGYKSSNVAKVYGVGRRCIERIVRGERWSHIS